MEPVNWRIAAPFAVLVVALLVPFAYQLLKPTDATRLSDQQSMAQNIVAEADYLADHETDVTRFYWAAEFDDLAAQLQLSADVLQHMPSEAEISAKRGELADIFEELSAGLSEMALGYENQPRLDAGRAALDKASAELNAFGTD